MVKVGLSSEYTYDQVVNSSKGVKVIVQVG